MSNTLRVVIAGEHQGMRAKTRSMLERDPEIDVAGEAGDGDLAVELVGTLQADILVLGMDFEEPCGVEVIQRVRSASPRTRVLVLDSADGEEHVMAAMQAGASGCLLTTARTAEIVSAVHSVADGDVVFESSIASRFLRLGRRPEPILHDPLTGREFEILRLAGSGMRNRQIAEELSLSQRTVETHLSRAFAKLKVSSRTQALRHALAQGWFALPSIF